MIRHGFRYLETASEQVACIPMIETLEATLGGDCLADIAVLQEQSALAGLIIQPLPQPVPHRQRHPPPRVLHPDRRRDHRIRLRPDKELDGLDDEKQD
jgi:hypothetical protein